MSDSEREVWHTLEVVAQDLPGRRGPRSGPIRRRRSMQVCSLVRKSGEVWLWSPPLSMSRLQPTAYYTEKMICSSTLGKRPEQSGLAPHGDEYDATYWEFVRFQVQEER
jgi:hypothetical protein